MGIRDEELKRLVKYAEGHNISVSFLPYIPYSMDVGYCTTDGKEIFIHEAKDDSKIEIILTFIHELGHALYVINNNERVPDPKLDEALGDEEKKLHRKVILNFERKGSEWWDVIYRDADLKFPKYKLDLQKEFDIWQYEYWYKNNKFPTKKVLKNKWKKLKEKYAIEI